MWCSKIWSNLKQNYRCRINCNKIIQQTIIKSTKCKIALLWTIIGNTNYDIYGQLTCPSPCIVHFSNVLNHDFILNKCSPEFARGIVHVV